MALIALPLLLAAQTYINKEWTRTAGEPGEVQWTANTLDWEGNLIVVGNTLASPGVSHVLTTKYTPLGDTLWQRTYAGSDALHDHGIAVITNNTGDVFVAATVHNTGNDLDFALIKYDANGDLLWDARWNGPADREDVPIGLTFDGSGSIYMYGASWTSPSFTDMALVKFNASGGVEWSATYDHAGLIDAAVGLKLDEQGNPTIVGISAPNTLSWDIAALMYDGETGDGLDTMRISLPGIGLHKATAWAIDEAGSLLMTGSYHNGTDRNIQTLKLTPGFTIGWLQTFGGTGHPDQGLAVTTDAAGNVYVCGAQGNDSGGSDFITLKYAPEGDLLWARTYRPKEDTLHAVATRLAVHGEGVVVTGAVSNGASLDFATVKYDADGELEWTREHGTAQSSDQALALAVGSGGVIYVSGLSEYPDRTYTTVKYDIHHKDNPPVLDSLDNPLYLQNEVIVKFRPHLLDTAFVDDPNMQHTTLDRVVPDSVAGAIIAKLGLPPGTASRIRVMKIFRRWTSADSISISRLGEQVRLPRFWNVLLMETGGMEPLEASDSLSGLHAHLAYAHPTLVFQFQSNDPVYQAGYQAGLAPTTEYPDAHINIGPAWAIQTGQPFIKVGVIDSPIKWDHEDFVHEGQTKVLNGFDYKDYVEVDIAQLDYQFEYGGVGFHGTACASVIGALRNNSTGVAGIAGGNVDGTGNTGGALIPLIVSHNDQFAPLDDILSAITEGSSDIVGSGIGFGCHILNASWTHRVTYPEVQAPMALIEAMLTCYRNHCVFVAAHGNHHPVLDGTHMVWPSGLPVSSEGLVGDRAVLSITATGNDGTHLSFESNNTGNSLIDANHHFGVDLAAPGSVSIVHVALDGQASPFPCGEELPWEVFGSSYGCFRGTSAAAPHVAGVAALMMAQHSAINGAPNNLAPEDVEQVLEHTALDIYDLVHEWPPYDQYLVGYDDYHGHGRLDAGAALALVSAPYCIVHSGQPEQPVDTQQFPPQVITVPPHNTMELPPGAYNAYRVEVTHVYQDVFDPPTVIIEDEHGAWERESSTVGTHGDPASVNGRTWADYDFDIDGSTATVTATTNCWFIQNSTDNSVVVNAWHPAAPAQLRTAYSLLVMGECWGPSSVHVEEPLVQAGITVYPNPAADVLHVDLGRLHGPGWAMEVFDPLGRVVHQQPAIHGSTGRLTIPIAQFAKGTYCLRIGRGVEYHTARFIKH